MPGKASDMKEAEEVKVSDVPKDKQKIFKINRGKAREKGGPLTKAEKGGKPQGEMFAMDGPEFEVIEKQLDLLIDSAVAECADTNAMQSEPSQEPEEELSRAHADIAGYGDPEDTEDEYPPGEQDDDLHQVETGDDPVPEENMYGHGGLGVGERVQLEFLLNEEDYKAFFRSMMDKFGISTIKDMSLEKKRDFFSKVGAAWRSKKEGGKEGI